jgi:type III restriction enzyme
MASRSSTVNMVANRLSLRTPQRESLELLGQLCDLLPLEKGQDVQEALQRVKAQYPSVESFEREFPSLCFALATGVGKTRLMGAFISYLTLAEGIKHYFVLAPNLTIYNKLVADFSNRTSPKYVFRGINEFVLNPPEIITGDNYEGGRGVRSGVVGIAPRQQRLFDHSVGQGPIHINIFNIAKITGEMRGGKEPRIKRLSEYIGESYFEYLSKLPDLVMLMDESHRYRADAGMAAINELDPIMGLELTATPQVQQGQRFTSFKNIIYSYPLSKALEDGFVKSPAVATRQNFNRSNYDDSALEKLKLEDGIRIHEETKAELQSYAAHTGERYVKPFILVVAKDTTHAEGLQKVIESDEFFDGAYKGRVITVHSNQRGEEKDENVQLLLDVEHAENPVEVVIHVDMLKEGWDVTNLYTIVPLRTADSRTLVEQSIGRGLRLPYGKRTGVDGVDRLTIVAHDRFQDIVNQANMPDSALRGGIEVRFVNDERTEAITVQPTLVAKLVGTGESKKVEAAKDAKTEPAPLFTSKPDQDAVAETLRVISTMGTKLKSSDDLRKPEIRKEIEDRVKAVITPAQGELPGVTDRSELSKIVEAVTEKYGDLTIDIPRVVVIPKNPEAAQGEFKDFDLDLNGFPRLQPVEDDILLKYLAENGRTTRISKGSGIAAEERPEDYIVRGLIDFDAVSYDDHAGLLYKLAEQVVGHVRGYLSDETKVVNVLAYHQRRLAELVFAQMEKNYDEGEVEYEAQVSSGFITLGPSNFTAPKGSAEQSFRVRPHDLSKIKSVVFSGFTKCLYPKQKYDSDPERIFSIILEDDARVLKWFKPARKQVEIYLRGGVAYEPDFVVETVDGKYLCEPKRKDEIDSDRVQEKAQAAAQWCVHASAHAAEHGTKPWGYALIPHDVIDQTKSFHGLVENYIVEA